MSFTVGLGVRSRFAVCWSSGATVLVIDVFLSEGDVDKAETSEVLRLALLASVDAGVALLARGADLG